MCASVKSRCLVIVQAMDPSRHDGALICNLQFYPLSFTSKSRDLFLKLQTSSKDLMTKQ